MRQVNNYIYIYLFVFVSSFGVCIYVQYFFGVVRSLTRNKKNLLELIQGKSKVHEKNVP